MKTLADLGPTFLFLGYFICGSLFFGSLIWRKLRAAHLEDQQRVPRTRR